MGHHDGQRRGKTIQYMGNGDMWPKKQGEGKGGEKQYILIEYKLDSNFN